jgi:hypothetical protein
MLSVWWNVDGIIHFELLPKNSTITAAAAFYAQQLVRVHELRSSSTNILL